jgi:hypothetical protein
VSCTVIVREGDGHGRHEETHEEKREIIGGEGRWKIFLNRKEVKRVLPSPGSLFSTSSGRYLPTVGMVNEIAERTGVSTHAARQRIMDFTRRHSAWKAE